MNSKYSKIGAVAITLMFCITAATIIVPCEDSDAASDSVTYGFYVQFVDKDKNFTSKQWYSSEQPNKSLDSFKNAYAVLAQRGINTTVVTGGWIEVGLTNPVIDGNTYYSSIFYASGSDWTICDGTEKVYSSNTTFAITFYDSALCNTSTWTADPVTITKAAYDALSADDKAKYITDDSCGYLLPGVSTSIGSTDKCIGTTGDVTYHFFVKFIDKDKKTISEQWYSAGEKEKSLASCMDAFNILSKYGIDTKMVTSGDYINITYPSVGTQTYQCDVLYASGSDWKILSDMKAQYGDATTFSMTFYDSTLYDGSKWIAEPVIILKSTYDALSTDDKAKYTTDEWNGHLLPGVSTTGYETASSSSSDNTVTIVIVAVIVAIVIIAIIAFLVIKKKKA